VKRLVDAVMGEAGDIDRASAIGIAGIPRCHNRGKVRHASARGQGPGGLSRIADHVREPGRAGIFDSHGARRGRCEARIFVRGRREHVAERRMKQAAARNVAHETRRRGRDPRPLDAGADIVEHGSRVSALLGELGIEPFAEDFGRGAQARRSFHLVEKCECVVESLRSELAPARAVRLERRGGFAQPLDFGLQFFDHQPAISRAASSA